MGATTEDTVLPRGMGTVESNPPMELGRPLWFAAEGRPLERLDTPFDDSAELGAVDRSLRGSETPAVKPC